MPKTNLPKNLPTAPGKPPHVNAPVDPSTSGVGTQHPGTFKPGGESPSKQTPTSTPGQTTLDPK